MFSAMWVTCFSRLSQWYRQERLTRLKVLNEAERFPKEVSIVAGHVDRNLKVVEVLCLTDDDGDLYG